MVIVFGLFCYCHSVIKSRATCRTKSRCQSDQSTVSVLANRSLHQDLMHSGCRGTAVPNVCLWLFLFPSSYQRPVHRLLKHCLRCHIERTSRNEFKRRFFLLARIQDGNEKIRAVHATKIKRELRAILRLRWTARKTN